MILIWNKNLLALLLIIKKIKVRYNIASLDDKAFIYEEPRSFSRGDFGKANIIH